jgi:hypothetical protein
MLLGNVGTKQPVTWHHTLLIPSFFFCIHIVPLHLFYFHLYTAKVINFTEDIFRIISPLRIRVVKTNLMHYLSSVYSVIELLHVSGIFVAHRQEIYCICTTTGMCCAFWLTVCWPGWDGTLRS